MCVCAGTTTAREEHPVQALLPPPPLLPRRAAQDSLGEGAALQAEGSAAPAHAARVNNE